MSSWFSSWLPEIPSINYFSLPSNIQRRFISFVLKRSLGHLLKPGQFEIQQIDSQIGSGHVQVNDLELDNQAINNLLSGLPFELVDGSIGSVTARIPWPNPLSSSLGFSLGSLHITLRLLPVDKSAPDYNVNLSDSVASYAESFIHDELNEEEASLKTSLRQELSSSHLDEGNLPGGLDPFVMHPEDSEASDLDPDGVSLFATLIERLLSKFEFDAADTKITVINPNSSRITITVGEISYRTRSKSTSNSPVEETGEIRTVSVSGFTIGASELYVPPISNSPTSLLHDSSVREHSPSASSSSSMDEETQWAMSQSLAFLPPRNASLSSSPESSMYQSALSSDHRHDQSGTFDSAASESTEQNRDDEGVGTGAEAGNEYGDAVFLSFGPDPVVIELATPSLRAASSTQTSSECLHLSVTTGFVGVAIRPWHLRVLMQLADVLSTSDSPPHLDQAEPSSPVGTRPVLPNLGKKLTVTVRGIALLLLPSSKEPVSLEKFFTRPSSSLFVQGDCVRLLVENISTSALLTTTSSPSRTISLSLSIGDISVFVFRAREQESQDEGKRLAFPIVITDSSLSTQYDSEHLHPEAEGECPDLPIIDVIDWTAERQQAYGAKISTWRARMKAGKTVTPPSNSVVVTMKQVSPVHGAKSTSVVVKVVPLHVFVDARQAFNNDDISAYTNALSSISSNQGHSQNASHSAEMDEDDDEDKAGDTPPATPRERGYRDGTRDQEMERKRLEKAVLEDLDLHYDYGVKDAAPKTKRSSQRNRTKKPRSSKTMEDEFKVEVKVAMIRAQIRCPLRDRDYSGAVVIDIHNISLAQGTTRADKNVSFRSSAIESSDGDVLASVEFSRLLLAVSAAKADKAQAFASIGPLVTASDKQQFTDTIQPLRPLLSLVQSRKSAKTSPPRITTNLAIPSVFLDLTKEALDSLQYWIDDISQLAQQSYDNDSDTEKAASRNSSLIGSRYFVQSHHGSGDASMLSAEVVPAANETVLKLQITEACIKVRLPRLSEGAAVIRPFDLLGSDIDILVELKPEGKDETVVTTSIMQLLARNHNTVGTVDTLLSLTAMRDLMHPKPLLKLRFTSSQIPQTTLKESRIHVSLWGFTYNFFPDIAWISDITAFVAAPPGAFENVVPSEKTRLSLMIMDGSLKATAPQHRGAMVLHMGDLKFSINLVGDSPDLAFTLSVPAAAILAIDNLSDMTATEGRISEGGHLYWKRSGFALLAEISNLVLRYSANKAPLLPDMRIMIDSLILRLHLCADTMTAISLFISDLVPVFSSPAEEQVPKPKRKPVVISEHESASTLMSSIDDLAFKRVPEIGPAPDMIFDDLPTNMDYLDESFGAAAGLREFVDDDLEDFPGEETEFASRNEEAQSPGVISKYGGETIRMLRPEPINIIEHHFDNLPPVAENGTSEFGETNLRVRIKDTDVYLFLYDGYDWTYTRKVIQEEVKEMRKKLAKIKQFVASGQTQEQAFEETSTLLFNSVYIGLEQGADELEPGALIAAIDEELKDDFETASQSSWQSLQPAASKPAATSTRLNGKRLTRSRGPSIEFRLHGINAQFDQYRSKTPLVSRVFATVKDMEILDHIKTSTWKMFLTSLRSDSRGNVRETGSDMVKIELRTLCPDDSSEEARLKAKILPLRLHVDQDALDFLKKFFSFKDPQAAPSSSDPDDGIYFQLAEIFPVDLKLDYKPRRVDYRALRDGRTIELMNFFHFDGAEMTLRHITLSGITGWPRLFDLLNDLWTPDVKATQLVDVISGVAPIRSVVNVGSGIADLVLLPIAQYKKDGRIVRGVQKGTTAFVKSTAIEAIKLGAQLATGTQVILEQAEGVLGTQFKQPITAETLNIPGDEDFAFSGPEFADDGAPISKYAEQPTNVREGIQSAYKTLQKNLNSAAQTILAVPMEVYERSGNEGPVHSVIRAVPIAVLKPMIGASEAVSKTLLGLHNSLDPNLRLDNDMKYKQRGT
ncbi:hypothetical protein D9758_000606 [Tetrapyrgos nigripes]|uniref:Autophagy-related protein 2 n=1 Tax=Tetrapyrgos nigripes TaxID=182062 RepID=A0A8H5GYK4_9AGAR|nr:hypothetical protein D9758_000606 [Tetrapyrgos nigripes]